MALWLIGYWASLVGVSSLRPVAISGIIGTSFVVFFWATGALILGLLVIFTRGRKNAESRTPPR